MLESSEPLVCMRGITKAFHGILALNNVDFAAEAGEIHGLVGENGAGKSTLMRILAGMVSSFEGRVWLAGNEVHLVQPRQAQEAGIHLVHQEVTLVPEMSAAENIYLGSEIRGILPGSVSKGTALRLARSIFQELGVTHIDLRTPVRRLGSADRQLVEIAKGLVRQPRVLIMDEPTTSLTLHEVTDLHHLLRKLRDQGVTVIYISHKLEEVLTLADSLTVLRDGKVVASSPTTDWSEDTLCKAMVGRVITSIHEQALLKEVETTAQPVLQVSNLSRKNFFEGVSFEILPGEILGLAGLIGAGRTEVAEAIFGLHPADQGEVIVDGKRVAVKSPAQAIRAGIAMVTDDRRRKGLIPSMGVGRNLTLRALHRFSRMNVISRIKERTHALRMIERLNIKTPGLQTPVLNLSGGNQQKVVLGRWLMVSSKVLILDEPTVGIDVGAKEEIRRIVRELAGSGKAILLISSELPEILSMSHRVLVMRRGRLVGAFQTDSTSEEEIMSYAAGSRTMGQVA